MFILGSRGTTFEKKKLGPSAIFFPRWPPPIFLVRLRSKSRLLSFIVLKLCIVLYITHGTKPIDFGHNREKNMAARDDFVKRNFTDAMLNAIKLTSDV